MTVSNTQARNDYVGTGSTATYDYNFKIFAASDLDVRKLNHTTNVETILSYPSDYSITGVGSDGGGHIVLAAGNLPSLDKLTLRFMTPLVQNTDIKNQIAIFPEVIETAFDRCVKIMQQIQEQVTRSVKVSVTDTDTDPEELIAGLVANELAALAAAAAAAASQAAAAISAASAATAVTTAAAQATTATAQAGSAATQAAAAAASAAAAIVAKITWRGAWSGATAYAIHDAVEFSGASYIAIATSTNQIPPNATYWNLLAARGTNGMSGAGTGDMLAAQNLADLANVGTARGNLGLGTMATQNAAAVAITGGSVAGITDVTVTDGGTGASTAANARSNLGVPGTDGSGASGTWPINIGGNAATATSAGSASTAGFASTCTTAANGGVTSVDPGTGPQTGAVVFSAGGVPSVNSATGAITIAGAIDSDTGTLGGEARIQVDVSGGTITLTKVNDPGTPTDCSLHVDSSVEMSNGTFKAVRDVRVGDFVRGRTGVNEVLGIWTTTLGRRHLLEINGAVVCTPGHLIPLRKGWACGEPDAFNENTRGKVLPVKGRNGVIESSHVLVQKADVVALAEGMEILAANGSYVPVTSLRTFKNFPPITQVISLLLDGSDIFYADGLAVGAFSDVVFTDKERKNVRNVVPAENFDAAAVIAEVKAKEASKPGASIEVIKAKEGV